MESSDEREKNQAYKAGFDAFRAIQMACLILLVVTFVLALTTDLGYLPMVLVIAIQIVGILAYLISSMKQAK